MKADIDAAGHEQVDSLDKSQVYINTAVSAENFPDLSSNIEFVQHNFSGVNQFINAGFLTEDSIPWCIAACAFAQEVAESGLDFLLSHGPLLQRLALVGQRVGRGAVDLS